MAKIPVMREFAFALEEMIRIGSTFSTPAAAGVLVAEVSIGITLLLGVRTGLAGFGAMTMAGVFAGVQAGRLLFGVEAPCYCLGVLGIDLPAGAELGLDIVLVGLSMVVIRGTRRDATMLAGPWSGRHAWLAVIIPVSFVSIPLALPELPLMTRNHEMVLQKVRAEQPAVQFREKEIVLCLNLDEFHCSLCFDDLVALLDSLRSMNPGHVRGRVAAALRSNEPADSTDWRLHRWARETGVSGPIAILQAEEFDGVTGGKSLVWITRRMDRILKMWELPLGERGRAEVLTALEER
jgi:hypothetical protein